MENRQQFLDSEQEILKEIQQYCDMIQTIDDISKKAEVYAKCPTYFRLMDNVKGDGYDYAEGGASDKKIELVARTVLEIQKILNDKNNDFAKYVLATFARNMLSLLNVSSGGNA